MRDYTYIDDAIDALLILVTSDEAENNIFYLGSGVGTKFSTMASMVVEICRSGNLKFIPYPDDAKSMEVGDFVVDPSKLKSLGWTINNPFKLKDY